MPQTVSVTDFQNSVRAVCPTNGKVGRPVGAQTVKAMLSLSLNVLRNVEYRFCADPNCPTVYYSADGLQTFAETDLRERVYQKHARDAYILVCYCFRHTLQDVASDGQRVAADINQGIKNGQCACDIRNPQGACCLGNVNYLVTRAQPGS